MAVAQKRRVVTSRRLPNGEVDYCINRRIQGLATYKPKRHTVQLWTVNEYGFKEVHTAYAASARAAHYICRAHVEVLIAREIADEMGAM